MTIARYSVGFILCLLLTAAAYVLVVGGSSGPVVLITLGVLALVQMLVQLVFFLHLGDEASPRYKLLSFVLMSGMLLIIVVGSLWIMANLDYNMMHMTPEEKDNYMLSNFDKGF